MLHLVYRPPPKEEGKKSLTHSPTLLCGYLLVFQCIVCLIAMFLLILSAPGADGSGRGADETTPTQATPTQPRVIDHTHEVMIVQGGTDIPASITQITQVSLWEKHGGYAKKKLLCHS